jgi:hypothetical protein
VGDSPFARLPTIEQLTLLEREMAAALVRQREAWDGLDRKGTTLMATTGVLLGLLANQAETIQAYRDPAPAAFKVALAMLVLGIVAGLFTLWPRQFTVVPDPKGLLSYAGKAADYTLGTLASTEAAAYERNRGGMQFKLWMVRLQTALLVLAAIALILILAVWR